MSLEIGKATERHALADQGALQLAPHEVRQRQATGTSSNRQGSPEVIRNRDGQLGVEGDGTHAGSVANRPGIEETTKADKSDKSAA